MYFTVVPLVEVLIIAFMQSRSSNIGFIQKAANVVIAHLDESNFSVSDLAVSLHLSREQTHRKLKKQTGLSSGKFIRYIRLLFAYSYLNSDSQSVQEVGYRVGFDNPGYFNKCFKEEWKCTPGEMMRKPEVVPNADLPILKFYRIPGIQKALENVPLVIDLNFDTLPGSVSSEYKRVLYILLILLLGIVLAGIFLRSDDQLEPIENHRLAILPFVNNTADTSMQLIGEIASSWISSQIDDLEKVNTVPFFTVKQYSDYLGILPNDVENRPTFGEVVNAKYLLQGQYFLQDEQLYFDTKLLDAKTLESIYHLPMIHGAQKDVMQLIEKVRLKVAGLITSIEEVKLGKLTPPDFIAYEHYLKGLHELSYGITPAALDHFEKAVDVEPDFVMPHLYRLWFYYGSKRDSLIRKIESLPRMTGYESNMFRHLCLRFAHKYREDLELCLKMLLEYPQDYYFNMMAAHEAKSQFMPEFAMRLLSQMEEEVNNEVGHVWHLYKVRNYTESLMILHKYAEAKEYLEQIPSRLFNPAVPELLIYCNIRLGMDRDGIEKLIASYDLEDTHQIADLYANAAYEYILTGQDADSGYFLSKSMQLMESSQNKRGNSFDLVDILFMSGRMLEARNQLELIKDQNEIDYWVYLSMIEAAEGHADEALEIYENHLNMALIPWRRNPLEYQKDYFLARVFALLGQKEKSVDFLERALENGQLYHHLDFDRDIFLKQIFKMPRFQKLVQPRKYGVDVTMLK